MRRWSRTNQAIVRAASFGLLVSFPAVTSSYVSAATVLVRSPGGRATVTLSVAPQTGTRWAVSWRGRPALDPAAIGLRFADKVEAEWRVIGVSRLSHDGMVTGLVGKASRARDRYNEATIRLKGGPWPLDLIIRAYDDGVAYRWRFRTNGPFAISDEAAGFGVPARSRAWVMPAEGYNSSYENYYRANILSEAAPDNDLLALPVLVDRGRTWAGITEAALHDWAGLYLVRHDGKAGLSSHLSPRLDRPGVAVVGGAGLHVSPWRVVLLGDEPGRLIESNLVTLLNPPADDRDWSWVKPGKTSFPWWNDYYWPGQTFTPGLNTATMDAYIDFDARHGIPYHTLDGYRDKAWYGGPIVPDGTPQDLTRANPDIDMDEVLARARREGVRIRLWCHWQPLRAQLDAALDQWQRWGVAGIMVDFMNRDDQEMVAFYDEIARKAADRHMTVVFHGAFKPTGENRTWPNLLTREAVRGTEYDKFPDNPGSTPEHEATTPFTRMLAGPMDIHEGGFDTVAPQAFHNRNTAPQVIGTRARALATYIVEENGLSMVADTPVNYEHATGFDFVTQVPTTWDETRVLAGAVGKYIAVARRKGHDWWLGAINDGHARMIHLRLSMLEGADWKLDSYSDAVPDRSVRHVQRRLHGAEVFTLRLTPAGGFAAHLSRS